MRYAVISDIHSNLEALTAFTSNIKDLKIDRIVCLGDIVGYSANPNECVDIVRELGIQCIMGNHDSRVAGLDDPSDFNLHAATAVYWTRDVITEENREFLRNLPRTLLVDDRFLAIHGWINDTDQYILGAKDALANFKLLKEIHKTNLCFFGHTHIPVAFTEMDGSVELSVDEKINISRSSNYLINPGSIGQPRNRDQRGSFLVYDSRKSAVNFYKFEYDVQNASDKIIAAGLPGRLAERLKLGW